MHQIVRNRAASRLTAVQSIRVARTTTSRVPANSVLKLSPQVCRFGGSHQRASFSSFQSPIKPKSTLTNPKMAAQLEAALPLSIITNVREFWFEHLLNKQEAIIPGEQAIKRWFFGGEEMDKACIERFAPTLEAIKACGVTSGQDILRVAPPMNTFDWLGLILLLDQMPRNCYRGADAGVVFNFFDPLALDIAKEAIKAGVPDQLPEVRWQFAYRNWFYLPLQHSEESEMHDLALQEYGLLTKDIESLIAEANEPDASDEYRRRAWQLVHSDIKAAKGFAESQMDFQKRHTVLIGKFGRYPHRNEALGRPNTEAENAHFASGGDAFGSGKEPSKK